MSPVTHLAPSRARPGAVPGSVAHRWTPKGLAGASAGPAATATTSPPWRSALTAGRRFVGAAPGNLGRRTSRPAHPLGPPARTARSSPPASAAHRPPATGTDQAPQGSAASPGRDRGGGARRNRLPPRLPGVSPCHSRRAGGGETDAGPAGRTGVYRGHTPPQRERPIRGSRRLYTRSERRFATTTEMVMTRNTPCITG